MSKDKLIPGDLLYFRRAGVYALVIDVYANAFFDLIINNEIKRGLETTHFISIKVTKHEE